MSLRDRLWPDPHFDIPPRNAPRDGGARLQEATTEDWFWGRAPFSGSEEDYYWRCLSDTWSSKDVLPGTYLELHNQIFEAYNANPLANAIIEIGVNFVLGDGLLVDAANRRVQALLDRFWNDPDNNMPVRQFQIATELALYGEIFVRFFVNPYNGQVKIGMLDPSLVDEIECDPENIERELRVHRRPLGESSTGPSAAVPLADPRFSEGEWYTVPDEVMHFAVNKVTNAKRGKSDLASILPWLRRYKDWLIDRVRINKYKAAFLWDVTLSGADRKMVEQKAMEYARPPESGSILVHNEAERWAAVQPNIEAGDVEADGHAIKMMIAAGAGLPEHFLAEGGDVNRATAAEMGLPTIKKYQRRQDYLRIVLTRILERVIEEAVAAGQISPRADTTFQIVFPDLHTEETADIGMASWHMAQGLSIARSLGLVSRETAMRMFLLSTRQEVDFGAELARLRAEGERKGD